MKDLDEENLNCTEWLNRLEQMENGILRRLTIVETTFLKWMIFIFDVILIKILNLFGFDLEIFFEKMERVYNNMT